MNDYQKFEAEISPSEIAFQHAYSSLNDMSTDDLNELLHIVENKLAWRKLNEFKVFCDDFNAGIEDRDAKNREIKVKLSAVSAELNSLLEI